MRDVEQLFERDGQKSRLGRSQKPGKHPWRVISEHRPTMRPAKFQIELLDNVAVFLLQTPAVFKRCLKLRDFEHTLHPYPVLQLDAGQYAQSKEVVYSDGALIKRDVEILSRR